MDEHPTQDEPRADDVRPRDLDEALRRLDALAEAAAAFAHDVKNPLSAVLLGVQRLARLADPARQAHARELATRLERSLLGMSRLLDGHAELVALQAGRLRLARSRTTCAAVLTRAAEPLRPDAEARAQALRVEVRGDLPEVEWDAERMAQAVGQALATALRLAPEGSTVECSAAAEGPDVVITIVVEGPAAPPASGAGAEGLAPPPHRIRGTGLLVARTLVEAHGGRVALEDGADRTTLRLTLPAHPTAAPTP